jgi:hypothetical protein
VRLLKTYLSYRHHTAATKRQSNRNASASRDTAHCEDFRTVFGFEHIEHLWHQRYHARGLRQPVLSCIRASEYHDAWLC